MSTPSTQPSLSTLFVELNHRCPDAQPVTVGVPLPRGRLRPPQSVHLRPCSGEVETGMPESPPPHHRPAPPLEVDSQALALWPDGSIQWLLLHFMVPPLKAGRHHFSLEEGEASSVDGRTSSESALSVTQDEHAFWVSTGAARFHISRSRFLPFEQVEVEGQPLLDTSGCRTVLRDAQDMPAAPLIQHSEVEHQGTLTTQLRLEGSFSSGEPFRFVARLRFWRDTGLVKVSFCLHNPQRARHAGGQWDLGDPGSLFFRQLALDLKLKGSEHAFLEWQPEVGNGYLTSEGALNLYQDSSGGAQWDSRNHLNHHGIIPQQFQGYRAKLLDKAGIDLQQFSGLRASPVVRSRTHEGQLAVAVPEFWQQFPKSLDATPFSVSVGLFPSQWADQFELQGGERKNHSFFVEFRPAGIASPELEWVHRPAFACATAKAIESSGVLPYAPPAASASMSPEKHGSSGEQPASEAARGRLDALLQGVVSGPESFFAGREVIDEYGWRNFGDVWANHEALHFQGPPPVISHFNNQYDLLYGLLLNQLRTGDGRWWLLADPLARHVMDIDIYHTRQDKAAYNGGLFWHTDHYLDAATCSHRTFSGNNANGRKGYGGGPGAQHNATSGLRLYYYLTGDEAAREAVLELADWVRAMDDGERNILGVLAGGPTGWATSTFDFFGAGRGAGYSLYALLDAWQVSGQHAYLEKAEALIRRTVHPSDDVPALDLLNAEPRWSYTIFLAALCRYLEVKAGYQLTDDAYAYGQAALVRYATWMLNHEYPYFDRKETLIFPTETWLGQEMRKANVLRMAARHVEEPLRTQLLTRGESLADRAWQDLLSFESRGVCRSIAIWSQEGPRDLWFRQQSPTPLPKPAEKVAFGSPETFVPQRQQIRQALSNPAKAARLLLNIADPRRWQRVLSQVEGSLKP